MKMEKITIPSHKDLFIRKIQEAILSGDMPIGSRVPPERELAEGMGVSRTVVNAGINVLVSQGFLTVVPRQGTFVADYRSEGTLQTLDAILKLKGDILSDRDVKSILEFRWAIEHLTMKNAVEKGTEEEIARMQKIVDELKEAKTPGQAANLCYQFQRNLASIGGNEILGMIIVSFREPILALWQRFCRRYGIITLHEHTKRSLDFIIARDYEGAMKWLDLTINEAINGDYTVYSER